MLAALPALGQPVELPMPAVEAPAAPPGPIGLTAAQLDQLVAPVALYPDPLLTDVLAASTYPAQVVEAQRFVTDPANAGLAGAALTDKAASHGWDASVQALLPFPQVLQMMDSNLEWTDRLGRAVIEQQADVMNAVQRLRQRAEAAGALRNGPQDTLSAGMTRCFCLTATGNGAWWIGATGGSIWTVPALSVAAAWATIAAPAGVAMCGGMRDRTVACGWKLSTGCILITRRPPGRG
jgi:hypothetical protein